jgi:hypothetical protein
VTVNLAVTFNGEALDCQVLGLGLVVVESLVIFKPGGD